MISILVIFYLQLNHNFPTTLDLYATLASRVSFPSKAGLGAFVKEFFNFYGHNYEIKNHVISLNVGRWQEKQLQKSQTNFSSGQKRYSMNNFNVFFHDDFISKTFSSQHSLRDGIASNPANWTNSALWVEDPVSLGQNIMAEISKSEANSFVKICQMFTSHTPKFDQNGNASIPKVTITPNQDVELFTRIDKEITKTRQPEFLVSRQRLEQEIISTVTKYIHKFDASLEIVEFGSIQYGIRGSQTNVNLLINTRKTFNIFHTFLQIYKCFNVSFHRRQ